MTLHHSRRPQYIGIAEFHSQNFSHLLEIKSKIPLEISSFVLGNWVLTDFSSFLSWILCFNHTERAAVVLYLWKMRLSVSLFTCAFHNIVEKRTVSLFSLDIWGDYGTGEQDDLPTSWVKQSKKQDQRGMVSHCGLPTCAAVCRNWGKEAVSTLYSLGLRTQEKLHQTYTGMFTELLRHCKELTNWKEECPEQ